MPITESSKLARSESPSQMKKMETNNRSKVSITITVLYEFYHKYLYCFISIPNGGCSISIYYMLLLSDFATLTNLISDIGQPQKKIGHNFQRRQPNLKRPIQNPNPLMDCLKRKLFEAVLQH